MYTLPEKLKNMTPYEPNMENYPIRLDANESFLDLVPKVHNAMLQALSGVSLRRYPDPTAKEVCELYGAYYGVDPRYITACNGSDEMLALLVNAFLEKDEKLCVIEPDFSMYRFYAEVTGVEVVTVQKGEDFRIDPDEVVQTLRQTGARMLLFSNPCNPTSLGLDREAVRHIITSTDALVVLDEAYMDFWDQSLLKEAAQYDNLIILRTCSKVMGLAGLRLGFAVANDRLTGVIRTVKSPYNVNALTQAAAAAAFKIPKFIDVAIQLINESRNDLYLNLKQIQPSRGFTLFETCTNFVTVRSNYCARAFEALKEQGILVRNFGSLLRITAGLPEQNLKIVSVLQKTI